MDITKASRDSDSFGEEEDPLMTSSVTSIEKWTFPPKLNTWQKIPWLRVYITVLHVVVFGVFYLLATRDSRGHMSELRTEQSWSPVQQFIEYEISHSHALNHEEYSQYSGPPTAEQDRAWDELLKPVYFKATREELERAGESMENKVELEEGGYLGNIGVYHELHCLRQLRFFLYSNVYYENVTEAQQDYLQGHLDHCIETLRLTIMCHGNTGVYSFAWDDPKAAKPATQSNSRSVCTKWSSIEAWSLSRMTSRDPLLVRPLSE